MPVPDLIRESFAGQLVYYVSGRRWLRYAEERKDFVLPSRYQEAMRRSSMPNTAGRVSEAPTLVDASAPRAANDVEKQHNKIARREGGGAIDVGDAQHDEVDTEELNIVDWYGPNDPACPKNVRACVRACHNRAEQVAVVVCEAMFRHFRHLLHHLFHLHWLVSCRFVVVSFSHELCSAIYSPGTQLIAEQFGISPVAATLGYGLHALLT
jgi:DHA1 family multidrug resistance protein-like MFS transporter